MNFACPTCREEQTTFFHDVPCIRCCDICRTLKANSIAAFMNDVALARAVNEEVKHLFTFHKREKLRTHKGNGAPTGPFAFTLTKSPNDDLKEEDMITAARKLMGQRSCPVVKYAWYLEYGDPETKSHPHIHGMYETETNGRIEAKHFKRAWPIWNEKERLGAGFRGGYHRPVRNDEKYSDYIKGNCEKKEFLLNEVGDSA